MPLWRSWWPEMVRSTFNNQMRTGIGSQFRLYLLNLTQNSLLHSLWIIRMRNISAIIGKYKAVPPIGGNIVSMKKHQNKASRKVGWLLCFRSLESASRWLSPLEYIRKALHRIINCCTSLNLPRGLIWSLCWPEVARSRAKFRPQASQATINSIHGRHPLIIYIKMTSFRWLLVELCTLGHCSAHISDSQRLLVRHQCPNLWSKQRNSPHPSGQSSSKIKYTIKFSIDNVVDGIHQSNQAQTYRYEHHCVVSISCSPVLAC